QHRGDPVADALGDHLVPGEQAQRVVQGDQLVEALEPWRTRPAVSLSTASISRTPSSRLRAVMSMTSTYSVSFESKCWYRTGLVTPAAAAISSIDVAWKPFWVNTLVASSSSCVRRCARGIRDVDMALTSGGWEGRYDIGPAP